MKIINTVAFFFFSTLIYSQVELKGMFSYIEENKIFHFENYKKTSDSIINCDFFNFSNFSFRKSKKNNKITKFKLFYKDGFIKFMTIKEDNFEYEISIIDYNNLKLLVFVTGDFCILKNENILFFDTIIEVKNEEIQSIKDLEGIYFMDSEFNPLRSLELNKGLPLSTSIFRYNNSKIFEEIIIDRGRMDENKICYNVYEKNIEFLFFKLDNDFLSVCSPYRKFDIELENDDNKTFLWFLNRRQKG